LVENPDAAIISRNFDWLLKRIDPAWPDFWSENGKPTIAQWSVFLAPQGLARRQASAPILSPVSPS
jgi:hypothetical protein